MEVKIENTWKEVLSGEFEQPYFEKLATFVKKEYQSKVIYPSGKTIFQAFWKCPFDQVKVVILGQDPYHGPNQAHGLSFSVQEGIPFPPSLLNIFKELKTDLGISIPAHGNLERWANQGVLLLNATLTVEAHKPGSHQNKGWESFTDTAIRALAEKKTGIVFMLWGAYAQKKGSFISENDHLKLMAPHPSPLSAHRGFLGSRHFSQANAYLKEKGKGEIRW